MTNDKILNQYQEILPENNGEKTKVRHDKFGADQKDYKDGNTIHQMHQER